MGLLEIIMKILEKDSIEDYDVQFCMCGLISVTEFCGERVRCGLLALTEFLIFPLLHKAHSRAHCKCSPCARNFEIFLPSASRFLLDETDCSGKFLRYTYFVIRCITTAFDPN